MFGRGKLSIAGDSEVDCADLANSEMVVAWHEILAEPSSTCFDWLTVTPSGVNQISIQGHLSSSSSLGHKCYAFIIFDVFKW